LLNEVNEHLLETLVSLCEKAGLAILDIYNQETELKVEIKDDNSPVTAADLAAHKVLEAALPNMLKGVPLLSEEGNLPAWEERKQWRTYWIIDPLDGTKEFINRNGEFTVNVALIHEGKPIMGVVHVPVSGVSYSGIQTEACSGAWKISGSEKQAISTRSVEGLSSEAGKPFVLVASRRHGAEEVDALIKKLEKKFGQLQTSSMGSSLKLCLVAEGKADLYPRLALTSEWDTAAAQAVVEAAGGQVLTYGLDIMKYNAKEDILNPWFYVVGDPCWPWPDMLG